MVHVWTSEGWRIGRVAVLIMLVAMVFSACSTLSLSRKESVPGVDTKSESVDTTAPYNAPLLPPPGLALSTEQRFKDIPLPVGIKEDLMQTYVYESRTLQIGRMVYTTRASVNDLAEFFLRECPAADWKAQQVVEAENSKTLVYTKPGKNLQVTVKELGFARGRRLIITLTPEEGSAGQ